MDKQDTITLKVTREEAELLISALWSRKDARQQYIAVMETYPETESFATAAKQARAELPKLELLRNKIYAAELGVPLQRYLSLLDRAQKNPPADVTSIHQGRQVTRTHHENKISIPQSRTICKGVISK